VGGTTARMDDPELTVRGPLVPRRPPLRVVVTRRGRLAPGSALARTAHVVPVAVLATEGVADDAVELGRAGIEVLACDGLAAGFAALWSRGVGSVLVEGGGRLAGALLAGGLVDRLHWVQAPLWLGDDGVPAVAGLPGNVITDAVRWRVVERRALGEDTLLVVDRR
ncbi:MAG: dihydrofolate reductase family protein, partial [Gemmatimonadales bacterium]|nr:dihydrofolate reductase family protein [Gemmatimonadales bacterium]